MKQLIKGIDIILHSGIEIETIHNVLVGNSTTAGTAPLTENTGVVQSFTLAIPKGDKHDWTNRIVEFWGSTFRTVGVPMQGIEDNMPLLWHKQVNVQRLDINGSCTIFEKDSYTKHIFENIYFYDARGQSIKIDGLQKSGVLNIQIYADRFRLDTYKPKTGDIVVIGSCDFDFDTSSQQAVSESMANFRNEYDFSVINSVSGVAYGNIPDYILTAK